MANASTDKPILSTVISHDQRCGVDMWTGRSPVSGMVRNASRACGRLAGPCGYRSNLAAVAVCIYRGKGIDFQGCGIA